MYTKVWQILAIIRQQMFFSMPACVKKFISFVQSAQFWLVDNKVLFLDAEVAEFSGRRISLCFAHNFPLGCERYI